MSLVPPTIRLRGRVRRLAGLLWLGCWLCCTQAWAQEYSPDEVKAAFLYRFGGYVQWPASALDAPKFTIAVIGTDATVRVLQRLLPTHPIHDHPAEVRRISTVQELGDAQMLYVASTSSREVRAITSALVGRPVLVVTDEEDGILDGGTVNFLLVDRRVRFEVSLPAAERNGLKISSELLTVAIRVEEKLRSNASCPLGGYGYLLCTNPRVAVIL